MTIVQFPKKKSKFAWSFSKLKNFRTCPKRSYECDITKNFNDKSDAIDWGQDVHRAAAAYFATGAALPANMAGYKEQIDKFLPLSKMFKITTERQLAINDKFQATGWFAPDTWFRAVMDVLGVNLERGFGVIIDWKTGKLPKFGDEYEQLELAAQVLFAHYPSVNSVKTYYVWLQEDAYSGATYMRDGSVTAWNEVWPYVQEMEAAMRDNNYPPKPGFLCKKYCPVTTCQYHGKGLT